MKLENEFTVPASIDEAWAVMLDIPRVAPCLPGATVEPGGEDGEYKGAMKLKIGPITASTRARSRSWRPTRPTTASPCARRPRTPAARAPPPRRSPPRWRRRPRARRSRSRRTCASPAPAAQFGRGVMQDVSAKMMRRFADCLAEEIGSGSAAPRPRSPRRRRRAGASNGGGAEVPSAPDGRPERPPASRARRPRPAEASSGSRARTRPPPRPTEDVLDLGEASRDAVLKRALPVVGGCVALLVLLRLIRR